MTYKNYGSAPTGFIEFCGETGVDPLEVTPVEIARYIVWLEERGTVEAGSLQTYLSAINRFLSNHARAPMALGPMIKNVMKGLANCQQDLAPTLEWVPLPAPVALAILILAEKLLGTIQWDHSDQRLPLLRAYIASVSSYMFFNRGECSSTNLSSDLIADDSHITLRLRNEKGHKARNKGQQSVRQIAVLDAPRPAAAIAAFFTGTATLGH
jgi:hypothetical protein